MDTKRKDGSRGSMNNLSLTRAEVATIVRRLIMTPDSCALIVLLEEGVADSNMTKIVKCYD